MVSRLTDEIRPFQIEGPGVRGRLVRLGPALEGMFAPHDYPEVVAALLGEAVALSCVLSSGLKYDGVFILQTQSDGPIRMMVADVSSNGDLRSCARFDEDGLGELPEENPVPHLLGSGHLAFTVDQGDHMERYQGITGLDGATLSECAHHYFRDSEQVETAIVLAADAGDPVRAAGLMIQRLPEDGEETDEDAWRRCVALMSSVTRDELLNPELSPEDLLFRLFHDDGVRLFEAKDLRYACRCSREKVAAALKTIDPAEVASLAEDGAVKVTCEFCKATYAFDPSETSAN